MAKKQFKAESKRLMEMMINSIYTHKEIFLREIISNASDAIDKLYFRSLTDETVGMNREDFAIEIISDPKSRTLIVSDNGCGMTGEEMEKNLGTIAKSGTLDFKQDNKLADDMEVIGQFGVGFYSAFMVSDKVTVISRPFGSDQAWKWESTGSEGYTLTDAEKEAPGTDIIMHIKEDSDEEKYSEYLDPYRIKSIIRKYSDYIRYPIRMDIEKSRVKEGTEKEKEPEYETYIENETLNSMVPLWKRDKNQISEEEYNGFYTDKFYDYRPPVKVIHTKVEGAATYSALLFIPEKPPYDYYTREFEKGLQLYSNGVLIMDKCADLLPDHFSFVRGLVDSQDLSLNISREMLQHDRQLRIIRTSLEKKIKAELLKMLADEREKYDAFFTAFGLQLKVGAYTGYGENKEFLQDLLLFYSAKEQKLITLDEYVKAMPEEQKFIYYAPGESVEKIDKLPQTELVRDKGFDILYLTDDVDEFVMGILRSYDEKDFKSVSSGDLGLETDEEKKQAEEQTEENKDLFEKMKKALGDRVKAVRLSNRLKTHPVCLTSEGAVSLEMEKILNSMPGAPEKVRAERVLELNANHPVFETLKGLADSDPEKLEKYSQLLYDQALLIEGLSVEDPVAYTQAVCELMT